MTAAHPFDSPRLTLERAKHPIRDLKEVIQTFTDETPWSYLIDSESQAPSKVYKIRFHTPPPAGAACILFDAVNNLRASLDQIGYSAAIASGKIAPRGTNFPFGKDKEGVEAVFKKNEAHLTLPPEIMHLFRSVEPYKGGNGQLLWAVNRLCNTKKHNTLVPTMITEAWATFTSSLPDGAPIGPASKGPTGGPTSVSLSLRCSRRRSARSTVASSSSLSLLTPISSATSLSLRCLRERWTRSTAC